MKKFLSILIAMAFVSGLFIAAFPTQPAMAQMTIYVDAGNITGPWDGTQANPYQSIQDGIDTAASGDIVQVAAGIYYENITLKDGVEALSPGSSFTTIDGTGTSNSVVTANGVDSAAKLDGFTITNGGGDKGASIYLDNSFLTISNCRDFISGNTVWY